MDLATVSARRLTGRVCVQLLSHRTPYLLCGYTNGIIPRRRLTWDGSAKFTCEPASRTASLLTSRYSVTAAGDQQRPQALCWSVLSAESPWPSLQRRRRWSKTWPKFGEGCGV